MSREFESLRTTSVLPDWLDEEDLADHWLVVMGGTHGDEQDQVEYVRSRMGRGDAPPGTLPMIANGAASKSGQRHVDSQQLMAWYPGRFAWQSDQRLTNEDRTAAGITWLSRQVNQSHLFIDRHSTSHNDHYAFVGERTTPAALAAAHLMGHWAVATMQWSSFTKTIPQSIGSEEVVPLGNEAKQQYYEQANKQLLMIASLGYKGLEAYYYDEAVGEQLTFYDEEREVCLVDPRTKVPDASVLSVLPELEAIETSAQWGSEITLSPEARRALGLHPNRQYYRNTPSYDNRSAHIDNAVININDNTLRRLGWASIMSRQSAPRPLPGTNFLVFNNIR